MRVELCVSAGTQDNEGVGVERAQKQQLDVLVACVGSSNVIAEECEKPLWRRYAIGNTYRGEEAVKLEEEHVGESSKSPDGVGQKHTALEQRFEYHVHQSLVTVLLRDMGLDVSHDVLTRYESVGGTSEKQINQCQ